ncbi:hypothetical protein EPUS_00366 [Endocarpon pusillum Z07020]|uniref:Uncharacterized protein n=1 Tax=Endocarpon pusillum (strain Z07020 / HMAS-L-300199) TaxID=1263415 RepID=U1GDN9_ENDPU|nr:uncharacterized protein EPUS_00366 [Endocarpon pusillum Z07020]ERF70178.1 hypothetical protein EPUS_00366 [Endocarpon pusillum Z07020]
MQSPCSNLRLTGLVSLFVCILAFGINAYTKQASRHEEQVSPYSSLSVLVGAPTSPAQTRSEAISQRNTPLPRQHTPPLFSHGGVFQRMTRSTIQSACPSPEAVARAAPPYSSENKHGRFHRHKRTQIPKPDNNDTDNDDDNDPPLTPSQPTHKPPSTLQTSSSTTTTTPSLPDNKPFKLPSPRTSTSTSTSTSANMRASQPSKRSPGHTDPYSAFYGRRDKRISRPALIILTLGSMMLLGLLLYLGWMVVWRDFGLDVLWEELRMRSADC